MNLRPATSIRETAGPTNLAVGAIADQTFSFRNGATYIGKTILQLLALLVSTKGDLITFTTTAVALAVGATAGMRLTVDPTAAAGIAWNDDISGIFGDGWDGDATLGTSTLTGPKNYRNLTVTGTLNTAGYALKVSGTLTFGASGIIMNAGGVGGVTNAGQGNQFTGGGAGSAGAAGATTGGNGTQTTNSWCALRPSVANCGKGGNGGQGNGAGSHPGGTGTVPTAPIAARSSVSLTTYDTGAVCGSGAVLALSGGSGGAAGGGDQAGATAGSGGGGGGVCIVAARKVDASAGGVIHADGGAGSNGALAGAATAAGGGGGGGGGAAVLLYQTSNTLPTVRAAGGLHGNLAGTGANGVDGTAGYSATIKVG